ncbi:hypothetical protein PV728_01665 [Streptomyces europaeiscabiei]|uniref:hypothetical protein n=1 Tax=Streptomyces europaeiscabiei TaxID=146819 RepID=UPI0029AE4C2D|nr:hypothetical protein [Streptomyces europaeiscabiei]MDX3629036.1 hypothetical protein [Streptomyces europaeiscabiei]MDX3647346.1 hypothetical protein [Streptomyces europaeiscabiei]
MITIVVPAAPDPIPLPRYEDYPSHDAYLLAFHIARAQRQDGRLNSEELAVQWDVTERHIRATLNIERP